jgi:multicomponent Na+:H+ antiporter subunit G
MEFIGLAILWVGVFFCIVGVIGLLRFPDVYTRLHASSKVGTLGLFGILLAAALLVPGAALKALALGIFMIISAPVAAHAIAAAAHRQGARMHDSKRDDLRAYRDSAGD